MNSFSLHIDTIREIAHKAYFSLISKGKEWGGFQPHLFLYSFDHMVAAILTYASEIGGFEEWSNLETLHLKGEFRGLNNLGQFQSRVTSKNEIRIVFIQKHPG